MKVGMLWFDDSKHPLEDRVRRAVEYYTEKYGQPPTHCMVHPQTFDGNEVAVGGVEVRRASTVMPNHFWIGIDAEALADVSEHAKAA